MKIEFIIIEIYKNMIYYDEAQEIIENEFKNIILETEEVSLLESRNRVLAEDIISDIDQPAFDNSAMDGIAIKYNPDITQWKLIGEIAAGNYKEYEIDENTCVRIMTGGKIPPSADTVVPLEDFIEKKSKVVKIPCAKIKLGQNCRYQGESMAVDQVAIAKNSVIQPGNIALIAGCGRDKFQVYKKLKIGVLATGDELTEVNVMPTEGKIRATNMYALLSEIENMNHTPVSYGFLGDDKKILSDKIEEIINSDIDILLTSGGVSVGKYDYLKSILEEKGLDTKFWRVYIKPGKPLLFGIIVRNGKKKYIFGLPGNPVSSYVTFLIFVKANIERLFSRSESEVVTAELITDLKKRDSKRHFSVGILSYDSENEKYIVEKSGTNSSGNMLSLSDANCLMLIDEETKNPKTGDKIKCIRI
ncbi:MAG: molybdopterin molybdotransferase MoeA [Candidatus Kapabacteria bacterium]|nr:molybdopterin molybdotransferase MoeA [Candidatus Kapabacteria bacterium]